VLNRYGCKVARRVLLRTETALTRLRRVDDGVGLRCDESEDRSLELRLDAAAILRDIEDDR
jgi:hypothetical protein